MTDRTGGHLDVLLMAAIGMTLLAAACTGGSGSTPPPTSSPPPPSTSGTCSTPIEPPSLTGSRALVPKPQSTGDRRTRRGRVYEELWKHQAALNRRRLTPASISAAATAEDIGQVAVIRDQGDLLLPANVFDLRATAVAFARNGAG